MLDGRRKAVCAFGVTVLVCAIAFAGVASAAGGGPALVTPKKGAHVGPGQIRLVVRDTGVLSGFNVFVQISPKRKLNKYGDLANCNKVSKGCDFLGLKRYKGHAGEWVYTSSGPGFPGYWATTAGRYYWQAEHVDCSSPQAHGCNVTSRIGSFVVR
jgi:hypothetical protein